MREIDLRSDTLTKPSPAMWNRVKNLNNDDLGDDVGQEDPTVNELERTAAQLVGKEAAVFVASGTMGNLISSLTHTRPGQEILVEEISHIYTSEVGGLGRLGGLIAKPYKSNKGVPLWDHLTQLLNNGHNIHHAASGLLCLENTHNFHGGTIINPDEMKHAKEIADEGGIPIHLDGARIFNAAVARDLPVTNFTKYVDSVQFCLSKGLSCPIGSIVAGTKDFIRKARKNRKMVGGGWRQAGIIAAMGLEALKPEWINRLKDDHEHANFLAQEISSLNPSINMTHPETNIFFVYFDNEKIPQNIISQCKSQGIKLWGRGNEIRIVTHYGISTEDARESGKIIGTMIKSKVD
jgi:threonine aldolase